MNSKTCSNIQSSACEKQLLPGINDIVCPFCLKKDPKIKNITANPTDKVSMDIYCPCFEKKEINGSTIQLDKYLDFLSKNKGNGNCCFRHKDKTANVFCHNCKLYMCNLCYSYHMDFEPSHKINIQELQDFCEVHPEQRLELYCQNCDLNLCLECSRQSHRGHKVIQLRDYWEKVNAALPFKSVDELYMNMTNQIESYNEFISVELEKINKIILSFQDLKSLIIKMHSLSLENNYKVLNLTCGVYSSFFRCKFNPTLNAIQNAENLTFQNMLDQTVSEDVDKIFNSIKANFKSLTKNQSTIVTSIIVNFNRSDRSYFNNVGGMSFFTKQTPKEKNVFLCQKSQREEKPKTDGRFTFRIPKDINIETSFKKPEEKKNANKPMKNITNNITYNKNSNHIDNSTTNNIIFPIKVTTPIQVTSKGMKVNAKKDIFTFDAVICSKYISKNPSQSNTGSTENSNQGMIPSTYSEGVDCITLGKVEDNKIIKKYKKKKKTQEGPDKIDIQLNFSPNNKKQKEEGKKQERSLPTNENKNDEDIDFFNKIFGNGSMNSSFFSSENPLMTFNETTHNNLDAMNACEFNISHNKLILPSVGENL